MKSPGFFDGFLAANLQVGGIQFKTGGDGLGRGGGGGLRRGCEKGFGQLQTRQKGWVLGLGGVELAADRLAGRFGKRHRSSSSPPTSA